MQSHIGLVSLFVSPCFACYYKYAGQFCDPINLGADGNLYLQAGTQHGDKVYSVDPSSRATLWEADVSDIQFGSEKIMFGWVQDVNRTLVALNPSTGEQMWSHPFACLAWSEHGRPGCSSNYLVSKMTEDGVLVSTSGETQYTTFDQQNSYTGHGGISIDTDDTAPVGLSEYDCKDRCDADSECQCVTFQPSTGQCWKVSNCSPADFEASDDYSVFIKPSAAPHRLTALDLTGRQRWEIATSVYGDSLILADGSVLTSGPEKNSLVSLGSDASPKWSLLVNGPVTELQTIDDDSIAVVTVDNGENVSVLAVDITTGHSPWNKTFPVPHVGPFYHRAQPVAVGSTVYIMETAADFSKLLHAFDSTGLELWSRNVSEGMRFSPGIRATVVAANDQLYMNFGNTAVALKNDGSELWRVSFDDDIHNDPQVMTDGKVMYWTNAGQMSIAALHAVKHGEELWNKSYNAMDVYYTTAPAVDDQGVTYAASAHGTGHGNWMLQIDALDDTGAPYWTWLPDGDFMTV